jgi:hypothetical protein
MQGITVRPTAKTQAFQVKLLSGVLRTNPDAEKELSFLVIQTISAPTLLETTRQALTTLLDTALFSETDQSISPPGMQRQMHSTE